MTDIALYQLKFPIGEFKKPEVIDNSLVKQWIKEIQVFPDKIKTITDDLTPEQLNLHYRPNGWSINQVVHHCADSHMNSYIRFKLALTEDAPTIKPYFEERWAELDDANDNDISNSIALIISLHAKWVKLLKRLSPAELKREFIHPEHGKRFSLEETIGTYAWHGNHHLAHIELALKKNE